MFLTSLALAAAALGGFVLFLVVVARFSDVFCKGYGLDVAVSTLTWVPVVAFGAWGGWLAAAGALVAQLAVLLAFCVVHGLMNPYKGPTIRRTLNRLVGSWRNYFGLFVTSIALPVFFFIRAAEIFVYPWLVWVLRFPAYPAGEWVNVSRHKFRGLVGHDLVWCLYCDWMTGVYSLGAEMLRNVESFWCPIRFYDGPKCENCKVDFPDVKAWVPADGSMKQVTDLLDEKYGDPAADRSWFGHPARPDAPPRDDA